MIWVSSMQKIVMIPARLASSRLPGKLLLDLGGKSVLAHVYAQSLLAEGIDAVYIATDSEEIATHCQQFTDHIIFTDTAHQSGTDRIAEAVQGLGCDIIVNVQGDEPFIDPKLISKVANGVNSHIPMSSAIQRIQNTSELHDPNVVKVVVNSKAEALYFSRSLIPHPRDMWDSLRSAGGEIPEALSFYRHIGIYGYTRDFLLTYSQMEPSTLEKIERLEQLRVLENGYTIQMLETTEDAFGIDTMEDYIKAQERIQHI